MTSDDIYAITDYFIFVKSLDLKAYKIAQHTLAILRQRHSMTRGTTKIAVGEGGRGVGVVFHSVFILLDGVNFFYAGDIYIYFFCFLFF